MTCRDMTDEVGEKNASDRWYRGDLVAGCLGHMRAATLGSYDLGSALGHLLKYAREHFMMEEQEMRRVDFPERADHASEHAELLSRIQCVAEVITARGPVHSVDVVEMISLWLERHEKTFDAEFEEFIRR